MCVCPEPVLANDRVRFHTRRCLAVLCSPVFVPEEQGTETLPGWQPCTTQLCVELLLFTVQSIVGNNGDLPRQALNKHTTFASEKTIERNGASKSRFWFVWAGLFVSMHKPGRPVAGIPRCRVAYSYRKWTVRAGPRQGRASVPADQLQRRHEYHVCAQTKSKSKRKRKRNGSPFSRCPSDMCVSQACLGK